LLFRSSTPRLGCRFTGTSEVRAVTGLHDRGPQPVERTGTQRYRVSMRRHCEGPRARMFTRAVNDRAGVRSARSSRLLQVQVQWHSLRPATASHVTKTGALLLARPRRPHA
jgi:hypothetical protein